MVLNGKKGFIGDAALVIAILLVLAFTVIIGATFMTEFNDKFQEQAGQNESQDISNTLTSRYSGLWDGIFMLVFGMLAVALIISVSLLGTRPEFFFITIIVSLFIIGGAAALSNIYASFGANSILNSAEAGLTFIPLIMNNLVNIALFLVVALILGFFAKARGIV